MAARHLLLLLTGCSLTLSGPDPNRPRAKAPVCDTSKALVALDGVMAATLGIVSVATASNNNGSAAVAPALLALAFIGSAVHGNNVVNACHRELESYDQAMAAQDVLPPAQPAVASLPRPAPEPEAQPQAPAEAPAPAPQPAPPPADDRWSAFWREVP